MQPHSLENPCPICGGHPKLKQGTQSRCWGFISTDGEYAHCTREELAGGIEQHSESQGYPHKLFGQCRCGVVHNPEKTVHDIGEARGARIVAEYDYVDEDGKLLFQVVRKEPKSFPQRRPNKNGGWTWNTNGIRKVLYRLPEVIAAASLGDTIYIVEGEKDVNAIRGAEGVATCNPGGAGKWQDDYSQYLTDADVVIVADRDEVGKQHARDIYRSIRDVAKSVRVVESAIGKDAFDHIAAGMKLNEFVPVWPIDELEKADPVAWKRAIVRRSLEVREDPILEADREKALREEMSPKWPTALYGDSTFLSGFRGVTFLSGGPSAGKSYWAIASAISAAWSGWLAVYLASEMSASQVYRRAHVFCSGTTIPDAFQVYEVSYGVSVQTLVDFVGSIVDERNLLVTLDSISSFVDQAQFAETIDVHKIGPLKQLTMWALNVRRETKGRIAFLMLSEKNAQGETKGRFGDHKADMVVTIATEPEMRACKRLAVTKSWESELGSLGLYGLDPKTARLTRIGD